MCALRGMRGGIYHGGLEISVPLEFHNFFRKFVHTYGISQKFTMHQCVGTCRGIRRHGTFGWAPLLILLWRCRERAIKVTIIGGSRQFVVRTVVPTTQRGHDRRNTGTVHVLLFTSSSSIVWTHRLLALRKPATLTVISIKLTFLS